MDWQEVTAIDKLAGAVLLCTMIVFATACRTADPVESALDTIFQSYYDAVRTTVGEPSRAAALIDIGRDLEPRLDREIRQLVLLHEGMAEMNADYGTSRRDMDSQLAAIQLQRQSIRGLLMAVRPDFVDLTTAEEWRRLQQRSNTLIDWLSSDLEGF